MPRPAGIPDKPVELVPTPGSYLAQIFAELSSFGKSKLIPPEVPEKNANMAALLGDAYLWDAVLSFAKKKSDGLWKQMEDQGIIPDTKTLSAGTHVLAESRKFVVGANMSAPVKRFSVDELAKALKKDYEVPLPRTKELCEKAKKGTSGQCRLAIVER